MSLISSSGRQATSSIALALTLSGIFTFSALQPALSAPELLQAPEVPPNPELEEMVDQIRDGAHFMLRGEEGVRLLRQYIMKRYVQDNCNAYCTKPCMNLAGWLWQNPDVICRKN